MPRWTRCGEWPKPPERLEISRGFIDLRTKAVSMEPKRRGQSADPASDDRDIHGLRFLKSDALVEKSGWRRDAPLIAGFRGIRPHFRALGKVFVVRARIETA